MLADLTPFSFLTVVLALLVLLGLVGLVLFLNWTDRDRVRRLIESQGGRVVSLWPREGPLWVRILNQQSITHWNVKYVNSEGQRRRAVCTAMLFRCYIESDEAAEERQES